MKVEGRDPDTGKKVSMDAPRLTSTVLGFLAELDVPDEKVRQVIDQLDVGADAKSALLAISKVTIFVGQRVIKIGRKVLGNI